MFYIYILANQKNSVLYTGVTNELKRRVYEHKEKFVPGFTKRYNVNRLVYYEFTENVETAISREKQIKNYSRIKKLELVSGFNKGWDDLYDQI